MDLDFDSINAQLRDADPGDTVRWALSLGRPTIATTSFGRNAAVMLHLAMKAFYPAKPPFPLLHVDTTWKFRETIEFRDQTASRLGFDLIVHTNEEGVAANINPFTAGSTRHTEIMKTDALKQALDRHGFDAAFGGP